MLILTEVCRIVNAAVKGLHCARITDPHRVKTLIMPEIAEVERARTILEQILKNQTIIDVEAVCHCEARLNQFDDPIVFKDTTANDFKKTLKGKTVLAVKRWGKYFWYTVPIPTLIQDGNEYTTSSRSAFRYSTENH
jgi:hypothetical protein